MHDRLKWHWIRYRNGIALAVFGVAGLSVAAFGDWRARVRGGRGCGISPVPVASFPAAEQWMRRQPMDVGPWRDGFDRSPNVSRAAREARAGGAGAAAVTWR